MPYYARPDATDSFSRPNPAALSAAGIKLAMRYLSWSPEKNLTRVEAAALRSHNVAVGLNWESLPDRVKGGKTAGLADATEAVRQANNIGAPKGCCIYYSVDFDAQPWQFATIASYFFACKRVHAGFYLTGVYGHRNLVDYLVRVGAVDRVWQCYAWSYGALSRNADLYQYLNSQRIGGTAVDFNKIIRPGRVGAWWPAGRAPVPPSTKDGFDMATLADLSKAITAALPRIAEAVWHCNITNPVNGKVVDALAFLQTTNRTSYQTQVGLLALAESLGPEKQAAVQAAMNNAITVNKK